MAHLERQGDCTVDKDTTKHTVFGLSNHTQFKSKYTFLYLIQHSGSVEIYHVVERKGGGRLVGHVPRVARGLLPCPGD